MHHAFRLAAAAAFLAASQAIASGVCFGQVNAGRDAQGPSGDMRGEVADLLQALRGLQTPEFAVEVRYHATSVAFLSDISTYVLVFHNAHRQPVEIALPTNGPVAPPPGGAVVVGPGRTLEIEGLEGKDLTQLKLRQLRGEPILSDLPMLGTLFKSDRTRPDRTLLVLITPRVVAR
jgi:hypothetical protein